VTKTIRYAKDRISHSFGLLETMLHCIPLPLLILEETLIRMIEEQINGELKDVKGL